MYYISNGNHYIGYGQNNIPTTVSHYKNAVAFSEEKKASNFMDNLKTTMKKFNWEIVHIEEPTCPVINIDNVKPYEYCNLLDTISMNQETFDMSKFLKHTISVISHLKEYANSMRYLENEYNKKICDVRHYKRDKNTKLNAIQLQRLEQFEIKLERERYDAKSNYIIAEIFLGDLCRIGNPDYINVIDSVKNSIYKPQILSYEDIDKIVGKIRSEVKNDTQNEFAS